MQGIGDKFEELYKGKPDPWSVKKAVSEKFRLDRLFGMINFQNYNSILDLGCGEGVFTSKLTKLGDKITCVDISSTAIERAKHSVDSRGKQVRFLCADINNLNVLDAENKFDLICCLETLYYLEKSDREKLLDGIEMLLRENGFILFSAPVIGKSYYTLDELKESIGAKFDIYMLRILTIRFHGRIVPKIFHGFMYSIGLFLAKYIKKLRYQVGILAVKKQ